jgi:anti-anti-sigma factor
MSTVSASVPDPALHPGRQCLAVDVASGRLTVTGRLNGRTARLLHDAVSALLQTDQPAWTVDVTELTVVDHAGLRTVIGIYLRAVQHDRRITLQGASPPLERALARMRLDRHLLPEKCGSARVGPASP